MNVLSVAAAYGVLVIVFQYGWTDSIIGFDHLGYVNALTPPLLLAIVFGLSMDYEVFLLSRIRERYYATGDNRLAVSQGLAASAKTISSAAIIMVAVFSIFALTGLPQVKEIGVGLGRGDLPRRDARAPRARPGHDGAHGQVELVAARLAGPHPARHGLREQPRAGGRARRRRAAARHDLARLQVRPLEEATWPDFARLVERHNGVWGGCWCMGFHAEGVGRTRTPAQNRSEKECRVREGRAHAALVYDDADLRGLVPVRRRPTSCRASSTGARTSTVSAPCRTGASPASSSTAATGARGVASTALGGALDEIARLGGGTVESYPEDSEGRSVSASFLHNGTVAMFERHGFERTRRLGKHHWVVSRVVR